MKENPVMMKVLLQHGADPNLGRIIISTITGSSPHSLEMVKLLDEYGVDLHRTLVNEYTGEPMNALSTAIDWGNDDVVEYLRSKGCVLPEGLAVPQATLETESLNDEIVAYFSEHFGPPRLQSLIEIVPTQPSIAVHVIPASEERKHLTLFTTGMSSQPMQAPTGEEDYQRAELFIQLPGDWPYQEISDPNHGWPIHWLRSMAKYPHEHQTWLGGPVTVVANEDPPEPLAPNMPFTSMLMLAERRFVSHSGETIQLYRLFPLYSEEQELELNEGIAALMQAFDKMSIPFVVDTERSCAIARQ